MKFIHLVLGLTASLLLAACGNATTNDLSPRATDVQIDDSAYVVAGENDTYHSDNFELTLTLPSGWEASDEETAARILNIGSSEVAGTDSSFKQNLDATLEQKTQSIFVTSKYAIGAPDNSILMGIAENVGYDARIQRADDYFDQMKVLLAQSAVQIDFADTYSTRQIGGQTFSHMTAKMSVNGNTVKQDYYAVKRGENIVTFNGTYTSDADKRTLDALIDSIILDWN